MSGSWKNNGNSPAWRRLRAHVLWENRRTNGGACTLLLPGCTGEANSVHHTLGREATGDDLKYLVACCGHCNSVAGNPALSATSHKKISSFDI